jgi:DNA-binding transcriptional LysR family regulator
MTGIPDWNRLRFFYIVSEAKSFSAAEEKLNLSQSAISRQISALEHEIKTPLFHRHARGLVLTDQGEILFETAKDIYKQINEAEALLLASKNTAIGSIKLTATRSFGTMWLSKRLVKFCKQYPDIHIELMLDDRTFNLPMREADFAIRMWKPNILDVVAQKFITLHCHYYASDDYIAAYGMPEKVTDLNTHKLIDYTNSNPIMRETLNHHLYFQQPFRRQRKTIYASTSLTTILHAVEGGLGIATLPDYMTVNSPNLQRILPEIDANSFETYLVYPQEIATTKRIQLLQEYLYACVREWCY